MKKYRLYLCLLLLTVIVLNMVACGQDIAGQKSGKGNELSQQDIPAQASVHGSDKNKSKINIEDISAYDEVSGFIENSMLSVKDGVSKYMTCCFVEELGVMTKNGESKYVMESELQTYRNDGWFVKKYGELYELREQLEKYISGKSGQYGIYIKNLDTDESLVINDGSYSSASIIKLFVMASVYNEIESENVKINKTISDRIKLMITQSDNYASNYLVRTIGGGNYLNGFNRENEYTKSLGCTGTQHMTLFSGYGDYVSYGRNLVSPVDCGILLEKIYDGTLVNKKYSKKMLSMLKNQQRRNKIPMGLPKDVECANKTGETSNVESDVAIVYSPKCDYIICVITNGSSTGESDIVKISQMTYNYFN